MIKNVAHPFYPTWWFNVKKNSTGMRYRQALLVLALVFVSTITLNNDSVILIVDTEM